MLPPGHRVNKTLTHGTIRVFPSDTGLEQTEKGKFCTIKRFGKLSDIPHFTHIIMTNIGQKDCTDCKSEGENTEGNPCIAQGQTVVGSLKNSNQYLFNV